MGCITVTYPFEVRVVPHLVLVLAQSEHQLEVDDDVVLVPDVRDVKTRVVRRDAVQESRVVHFDNSLYRKLGNAGTL